MSFGRKLAKVFFCAFLGLSSMSGFPMDPKQIEELLELMNKATPEVLVLEPNGNNEPNPPIHPPPR